MVIVPGSKAHTVSAAVGDTRRAIDDDEFAYATMESIDTFDCLIDDALDTSSDIDRSSLYDHDESIANDLPSVDNGDNVTLSAGDCIEVFWPLDSRFFPVAVSSTSEHLHITTYDYGDVEQLRNQNET